MDTTIDVFVEADTPPAGMFAEVRLLFEQQEQRFSRFRPKSLLSRLNAREAVDDPWLREGLEMAIDAWETTEGLFNPMVLPALRAAGYDRTFRDVRGGAELREPAPAPADCLSFEGDGARLLAGQVDLGGIVKGWTADLAAEHLAGRFPNVMVNAGGDIRCVGGDAAGGGWLLEVDAPNESVAWEGRVTGAIATSTTLKRRWRMDGGREAHHLIDPRTGAPARDGFLQVTARAGECWIAEVWAKAILIGGEHTARSAEALGVPSVAFAADGEARFFGEW